MHGCCWCFCSLQNFIHVHQYFLHSLSLWCKRLILSPFSELHNSPSFGSTIPLDILKSLSTLNHDKHLLFKSKSKPLSSLSSYLSSPSSQTQYFPFLCYLYACLIFTSIWLLLSNSTITSLIKIMLIYFLIKSI